MEGHPAVYLGKIVSKNNFRVFIYDAKCAKKLVNSWDEFERHIATGAWFESVNAAIASTKEEPREEMNMEIHKAKKEKTEIKMRPNELLYKVRK